MLSNPSARYQYICLTLRLELGAIMKGSMKALAHCLGGNGYRSLLFRNTESFFNSISSNVQQLKELMYYDRALV